MKPGIPNKSIIDLLNKAVRNTARPAHTHASSSAAAAPHEEHPLLAFLNNIAPTPHESNLRPLPPITSLALQGGGPKGEAYLGALEKYYQLGFFDELKEVAGSSAGAITAFLVAMGFDGKQIADFSKQINFLDFLDADPNSYGWIAAALYSGYSEGRFAWELLRNIAEIALGDPDATFGDLAEAIKLNPALQNLNVTATRILEGGIWGSLGEPVYFSADNPETRDVVIADAVRASMAFPSMFKAWTVRKRVGENQFVKFGDFNDGGIYDNLPVDVYNQHSKQNPNYPLTREGVNPCTLGLSLYESLENLDPKVTPFGQLVKTRTAIKSIRPASVLSAETKGLEQPLATAAAPISPGPSPAGGIKIAYHAVMGNKYGRTEYVQAQKPADIVKKMPNQIVQIWSAGITVTNFARTQEQGEAIVTSGAEAMAGWTGARRNPAMAYNGVFVEDQLPIGFFQDKRALMRYTQSIFVEMLNEIKKISKQGYDADNEIVKNIKLKYLKSKLDLLKPEIEMRHKENYENFLEAQFAAAVIDFERKAQLIQQHRQKMHTLIDPQIFLGTITDLIRGNSKNELIIRMLNAKISNIIKLSTLPIDRERGQNLLGIVAESNDLALIRTVIDRLNIQIQFCKSHKRDEGKISLTQMLIEKPNPPLFQSLFKNRGGEAHDNSILEYFLKELKLDPCHINEISRTNAMQEAIIQEDYDSFKYMLNNLPNNQIEDSFIDGNALHYIINHLSPNSQFVQRMRNEAQNYPENIRTLLLSELKTNAFGNNPVETAAVSDAQWWPLIEALRKPAPAYNINAVKETALHRIEEREGLLKLFRGTIGLIDSNDTSLLFVDSLKPGIAADVLGTTLMGDELNLESKSESKAMEPDFEDVEMKGLALGMEQLKLSRRVSNLEGISLMHAYSQNPDRSQVLVRLVDNAQAKEVGHNKVQGLINKKTYGQSPIVNAAASDNADFIKVLMRNKYVQCDPAEMDRALLLAAKNNFIEVWNALYSMRAVQTQVTQDYYTLQDRVENKNMLHYFAEKGNLAEFMTVFKDAYQGYAIPAMVLMHDNTNKTFLHYIVENNRKDFIAEISNFGSGYASKWKLDHFFNWKVDSFPEELVTAFILECDSKEPHQGYDRQADDNGLFSLMLKNCSPGFKEQFEAHLKHKIKDDIKDRIKEAILQDNVTAVLRSQKPTFNTLTNVLQELISDGMIISDSQRREIEQYEIVLVDKQGETVEIVGERPVSRLIRSPLSRPASAPISGRISPVSGSSSSGSGSGRTSPELNSIERIELSRKLFYSVLANTPVSRSSFEAYFKKFRKKLLLDLFHPEINAMSLMARAPEASNMSVALMEHLYSKKQIAVLQAGLFKDGNHLLTAAEYGNVDFINFWLEPPKLPSGTLLNELLDVLINEKVVKQQNYFHLLARKAPFNKTNNVFSHLISYWYSFGESGLPGLKAKDSDGKTGFEYLTQRPDFKNILMDITAWMGKNYFFSKWYLDGMFGWEPKSVADLDSNYSDLSAAINKRDPDINKMLLENTTDAVRKVIEAKIASLPILVQPLSFNASAFQAQPNSTPALRRVPSRKAPLPPSAAAEPSAEPMPAPELKRAPSRKAPLSPLAAAPPMSAPEIKSAAAEPAPRPLPVPPVLLSKEPNKSGQLPKVEEFDLKQIEAQLQEYRQMVIAGDPKKADKEQAIIKVLNLPSNTRIVKGPGFSMLFEFQEHGKPVRKALGECLADRTPGFQKKRF